MKKKSNKMKMVRSIGDFNIYSEHNSCSKYIYTSNLAVPVTIYFWKKLSFNAVIFRK